MASHTQRLTQTLKAVYHVRLALTECVLLKNILNRVLLRQETFPLLFKCCLPSWCLRERRWMKVKFQCHSSFDWIEMLFVIFLGEDIDATGRSQKGAEIRKHNLSTKWVRSVQCHFFIQACYAESACMCFALAIPGGITHHAGKKGFYVLMSQIGNWTVGLVLHPPPRLDRILGRSFGGWGIFPCFPSNSKMCFLVCRRIPGGFDSLGQAKNSVSCWIFTHSACMLGIGSSVYGGICCICWSVCAV